MPSPPDRITIRLPAKPTVWDVAWYTAASQVALSLGYQLTSVHCGRRKESK